MIFKNTMIWMPYNEYKPNIVGSYLVITCKGRLRIDRWDGEAWGLCRPRNQIKSRDKGRYKPHRAWCYIQIPKELMREVTDKK